MLIAPLSWGIAMITKMETMNKQSQRGEPVMKKTGLILLIIFLFLLPILASSAWGAEENLDEMIARKSRYAAAAWGKQYLEDPKTYVWQPESLTYTDVRTGHEVWVLIHGPDEQAIYSKEYATNAWSYDGFTLGVWISSDDRGTNNPKVSPESSYFRWLVKSDGSYLKASEGYGNQDIPQEAFGWAHTENAYYSFGSHRSWDVNTWELAKNVVSPSNVVTPSVILDTATAPSGDSDKGVIPTKKGIIKRGISADDEWLSCSARSARDYGRTINCYGHMRIHLKRGANPTIEDYWGVNRDIYEYADHSQSHEYRAHGGGNWAYGFDHEYSHILYPGGEHIFFQLKSKGTDMDGGPRWEDWNGDSYGANEIIPISAAINRDPNPPGFFHHYWGHPSIDRWEKYILWGDGDPTPGTRVTLVDNPGTGFDGDEGQIADDLSTNAQYDGRHHAWDGWTDHVVFFPPYIDNTGVGYSVIYGRKLDFQEGTKGDAYPICSTHLDYQGNYKAYPRPSQSPDGTKVAFHATWLNNGGDDYPYISYAVAYYPYPPTITGASKVGGSVRISWNSPKYTTRGWPDEATDPRPEPREIKYYHVWVSPDTATWSELTTTVVPFGTNYYHVTQPNNTTRYYAMTSEEHSRLESRTLSNTWRVTMDEYGNVVISEEASPYPNNPGGVTPFWTIAPPVPSNLSIVKQSTPGHYRLSWVEPTYSKIRYYNIYYSTEEAPPVDQRYRIASVPVGTSTWLDWGADPDASAYYRITSVDRYGNESGMIDDEPPNTPSGLIILD
jgi:hypothetical protein